MKKLYSLFMVAVLMVFLVACNSEGSSGEGDKKLALLMADLGNPFFHVLRDAVKEQAESLGYEVIVYDGQNDASKQPSQVEDALQKGVSAIVINPGDEDSTANALKEAIAQGIPVVTVDRKVNIDGILSYLVTDNTKGGELTGEWLANKLPEGGNVVHIEGVMGTAPQRERGGGFLSVIDPAQNSDSKFTILDTVVGDFSMAPAEAAMSDLLAKHDDIDAVFAQNDTMAVGVVRAIETAGRDKDGIIVIGFDGAQEAYDLIEEGKMSVTAVQDFKFIGKEAVNYVDAFLKDGTKPEPEMLVDVYMSDSK
ncbi:sugar ABC transporter substrate-binding protein [Metasolibacillus sp. FSL H7-0170]|uniref:sugar ABC transporter substrate-binding protein n=1 Tax=Metasolibacillus TaxID=2703677 RepID=UPI00137A6A67|nr:sugar ABC transporter substrate-binding protein [Metasolibacillus fluoroglycofenilyticus]